MTDRVAALLAVDDALLAAHPEVYGVDPARRCVALAQALASSPAWERIRVGAAIAVRAEAGLIAVLGSVSRRDRPLVDALGWQVEDLLRRLLPVPFPDVEQACFELAGLLRAELSADELRRARLLAIPRGGLIVAGMLAYALGMSRAQVGEDETTGGPTILVDDCALSGTRLREWLGKHRGEGDVVVALLHAHPDLRRRVEEQEASVRAVLVARDLEDHAVRRADYVEWLDRWSRRSPLDYWTGDGDHVCYPWNEPDVLVWNGISGDAEPGWHVVPPTWCIKNRADGNVRDVQECRILGGPVRPAARVVWARVFDSVLVAHAGTTALALRGRAALMWEAMVSSRDPQRAMSIAAAGNDQDPRRPLAEVERFMDVLGERGLLVSE